MDNEELICAWKRWDDRPGDSTPADWLQTAIEAWSEERNKGWLQVRRSMHALLRQGFTKQEVLEALEI